MAFYTVWIALVSIIATFDIEAAVCENGKDIEPSPECVSDLLVHTSLKVQSLIICIALHLLRSSVR